MIKMKVSYLVLTEADWRDKTSMRAVACEASQIEQASHERQ